MRSEHHSKDRNTEISIRIATTVEEYETAFRIAYGVYHPKGFTPFSRFSMRATPYQVKPSAVVLLAYIGDTPIATLSIYEGPAASLPSSSGWPSELAGLEERGLQAVELGTLMVLPEYMKAGSSRICLEAFRAAWHYAGLIKKADVFCAFVQAHHQRFYEKILGFKSFGPVRHYEWNGLNIGDVVPLSLNLSTAEAEFKKRFSRFGQGPRNLYRFFTQVKRCSINDQLLDDLKRREHLDWERLKNYFSPLLVEPSAADNDSECVELSQFDSSLFLAPLPEHA